LLQREREADLALTSAALTRDAVAVSKSMVSVSPTCTLGAVVIIAWLDGVGLQSEAEEAAARRRAHAEEVRAQIAAKEAAASTVMKYVTGLGISVG
jgi:hypothetical protein